VWKKQRATTDTPLAGTVPPLTTEDLRRYSATSLHLGVALESLAAALEALDGPAIGATLDVVAEASFKQAAIMRQLQAQIRALPLPARMRTRQD
jgi:hypothetical protein